MPFLIPEEGEPAGFRASSGTGGWRGGLLSRAAQKPWGQVGSPATRSPTMRQGGPPGRDRTRSKGPGVQARALSRTLPAARCREAGGAHSPLPTSGTRLRELPLLRVRASELPPAQSRPSRRSRALLQPADCRKGQGAPRVPGSDGLTAQRARRRPPSATRPRRRFPRARFGGGAALCAPIGRPGS